MVSFLFGVSTDNLLVVSNLLVTVASLAVAFASFALYVATLRAISKDERQIVRDIVRHPISKAHKQLRAQIAKKVGD